MTELSDAHPTLSDEKSSFTLSDAQPELCVVTLSHCDSLSTCARLLMDAGCLLETRDADGDTPLHKAAAFGGLQTAKGDLNDRMPFPTKKSDS